ncbi:MarR family winged helix-turn-helix transcriptional regulator [Gordonia sp. OPL2]|uniref:MarR family winged helix-turn-helix transcriptional regulator n=1 Tax=Gordonia sp. OPL2 TaxID=2486274 RepID=UPI0016558100|nr:MarR family winged helix-turn-helix transcriptional regulator [Gordonia sp. OPL2]RPA12494.1 MarR family transcriptional regulator [Gordonia sp. OPL2]
MADAVSVAKLFSELYEAAGAGRRLGEGIAAQAGQTQARWQTLWTIGAGPMTVPQIARRLGVSRQHILRLTNSLADEGLIESGVNPDHKTSPLLDLTPTGREVLDMIDRGAQASNEALLQQLSDSDVELLRTLLQRFTEIVKSMS